ncbi:MAG: GH25 family lysozyme [Paludibacteraceae bacterium]|nr:GH25 family lysozyme [Paludibacteraceae bacterium]
MHRRRPKKRLFLLIFLLAIAVYYCNKRSGNKIDISKLHHVVIPDGFSVIGIDVSHHNGDINWKAIRAQGIVFAYIKATEGESLMDKNYTDNYRAAKTNRIVTGMYHFFIFRKDGGAKQALCFLNKLRYQRGDLPPAVDVEYSPSNRRTMNKDIIKERIRELNQFDSTIYSRKHIHPVLYTNKECYEDLIRDNFPKNDLWLCNLSDMPDDYMYPNWVMWQYSHTGKLEGVKSSVDINVFYAGKAEFNEWLDMYKKAYVAN